MILALEQTVANPEKILGAVDWLLKVLADPHHLIIVALWFVGYLAKHIRRINDDDIPLVIIVFAIIFCVQAFWGEWQAFPRAMVYAGLALLGNRLYKRWIQNRIGDNDEMTVTVSGDYGQTTTSTAGPAVITVEKTQPTPPEKKE